MADSPIDPRIRNEQVLSRELSAGQQAMMAIGGAIGTGLFLGSGLAVNVAGPGVVLSYVLGSIVSLLLGAALTEMCVAHPTAGSFGVYAEMYVSPFAGYAVRLSYWLMQIVATGGHMVAVSIYMRYWFPDVPGSMWVVAFSAALVYVNSRPVATIGRFEYWFAMIKVAAIAVFAVAGIGLVAGWIGRPAAADPALTGVLPHGLAGVLLAVPFVIYSFIGVEIVGVTSGEAREPGRTIPIAFFRLVLGLSLIYIVTTALLVRLVPWQELGVGESPFVKVLTQIGLPAAASLMNVVVLSVALFGALFVWLMIFITHLAFRRHHDAQPGPPLPRRVPFARSASALGAVAIVAILGSTWWVPDLRITVVAGVPWLAVLALGYAISRRARRSYAPGRES